MKHKENFNHNIQREKAHSLSHENTQQSADPKETNNIYEQVALKSRVINYMA